MILADTNILIRSIEANHLHQLAALDAVKHLSLGPSQTVVVSPQVLIEFYAVATRALNGLRLTPDEALSEIEAIRKRFELLPETVAIFPQLEALIVKYKPVNRHVFDTRHVAFMLVHQIPTILTFNDKDFQPMTEIQTLNPFDVLGIPRV